MLVLNLLNVSNDSNLIYNSSKKASGTTFANVATGSTISFRSLIVSPLLIEMFLILLGVLAE